METSLQTFDMSTTCCTG